MKSIFAIRNKVITQVQIDFRSQYVQLDQISPSTLPGQPNYHITITTRIKKQSA